MKPCTTFAHGINPFRVPAALPTKPEPIMQKPAKPAKTKLKDKDYSTPYKPPQEQAQPVFEHMGITITDDPIPGKRVAPPSMYKPLFERLEIGKALRVSTDRVNTLAGALRKHIRTSNMACVAHVAAKPNYTRPDGTKDTGFGRVWLKAGESPQAHRAKKVAA